MVITWRFVFERMDITLVFAKIRAVENVGAAIGWLGFTHTLFFVIGVTCIRYFLVILPDVTWFNDMNLFLSVSYFTWKKCQDFILSKSRNSFVLLWNFRYRIFHSEKIKSPLVARTALRKFKWRKTAQRERKEHLLVQK